MKIYIFFVLITLLCKVLTGPNIPQNEKSQIFWNEKALADLKKQLSITNNNNIAKNVIMYLGDGMGPTTVTAARILRGQLNGRPGEETVLAFDDFPNVGLSKTYNVDRQTPDSAGTATAYLCGVKANYFTLGLDATATAGDCTSQAGKEVTSILDWSKSAGKTVGIVTTTRLTHASPAGCYAHSADRYWEGDVNLKGISGNCKDIAYQLVHDNNDIDVLLGGGRRYFMLNNQTDPEYGNIDSNQRRDGHDLIKEWKDDKLRRNKKYSYVWKKEQFDAVNPENVDYLLGLFEPNHMQYELERNTSPQGEPSLAEMTQKAIQILKKNDKGFFLFVEGGRIDHAHHDSLAKKALHEVLAMEDAVNVAMETTDEQDTLIVVTADHSHVFDITGYPYRGNDIFGLVTPIAFDEQPLDNLSYSTLIYGNGPNARRTNLTGIDTHHNDFVFPSAVPLPWETHGGEDVAIYARGPMSHLFRRTHEQNYIPHVMAFASCVGAYQNKCDRPVTSSAEQAFSLGSIVQDKGIYWDNVLSQPINVIIVPYKEEKPKITTPATQVGIFNSSRAEAISPKSVTSNLINTNTPILKHVYKRETILNTALNATASLEKKPLFSQEPRVSQRNRIQSEKSKQDELSKSVTFHSLASFDDLLSGGGIRRIEGVDFKAADHTLYQDFPTVNSSHMTDSFGSLGNPVAPPETSEILATAMKSIVGGGGGLGTIINTILTINRLRSLIAKRKSKQASNMNGFGGMMGGAFPMGGMGGLGAQQLISLQSLQQQVHALQQQVALQTSQLSLQNQLGLQSPLAGLQNPYGLQNSQPQLGLGTERYNQFGTGGFQLDYLPQNQFGQFMPSLGGNPFDGSSGIGGMSNLGAGSSFGHNSGGALGGSLSGMFGGQPNSFMLGGGVNTGLLG